MLRSGQREGAAPRRRELSGALRAAVPKLAGLVLNVNLRDTNVILGDASRTLWGRDWLEEELCGLTFRLSVPSFFQINRDQTERLYQLALEFAGLTGEGDGAGPVLRHRHHLPVPGPPGRACHQGGGGPPGHRGRQGQRPAQRCHQRGILLRGRGEVAARLAGQGVRPQVICVDPPRKGLAPRCRRCWPPWRRTASSTSPATRPPLARDVKRLEELGYRAVQAQPVDLFPRTAHVETVVLLSKGEVDSKKDSG